LRWIWNHPGVVTVLSGMNRMDQIDENVKIAETAEPGSLSGEELKIVEHAAETFRGLMKTPCTGCQYCLPCPQNVNIPAAFSFYNNKHLFKQGLMNRGMYLLQLGVVSGGKPALAGQCVACGACVKRCPQRIDIPTELKKVEKEFEGKWTTKPLMFLVRRMFSQGKRKTPSD
jgi:predicted aldo/keto reductase-like oxidoreductase